MTPPKAQCAHSKDVRSLQIVSHNWDGEAEYEYMTETVNTYEDVDLHRYQCTQCKKMFYYSERARQFFEQGIENETYGLTMFNLIKHGGVIPKDWR